MIGQKKLKDLCERWKTEPMPGLLILAGDKGYGKKTAVEYIRKNVPNDGILRAEDNSVATVRAVIDKSYALGGNVFYVFTDCDNMSVAAKNALLKVMEEPPNGARFILTVQNLFSLLPTIVSRAFVYQMKNYTFEELNQFAQELKNEKIKSVFDECFLLCPGDILWAAQNLDLCEDMIEYADNVVKYIGESTQANALKISTKLDLKGDDPTKYPIDYFLRLLRIGYFKAYVKNEEPRDFACIYRIQMATMELRIQAASKQNIIDTMLLDLRRAAREEDL